MSTTIVSCVIAGCEVTGKLHHDVQVRSCKHPVAETPFCPECGQPMHRIERQRIPGYDGDSLDIDGRTWNVVTDGRHHGGKLRSFVGVTLAEVVGWQGTTASRLKEHDPDASLETVRDTLTSIGLWDPMTYGIWNVLYVSS